MIYTLDRFEGNFAILIDDNKDVLSVDKSELKEFAEVNNVFESENKTDFIFLKEETEKRKKSTISLHRSLFKR